MGKDYIPLKANRYDLQRAYHQIAAAVNNGSAAIVEGSTPFFVLPAFNDIKEIEAGTDGTEQTVLQLKDDSFYVVEPLGFDDLEATP